MIFLGFKSCNFENNIHFMKKEVPFKLLSLLVILMTTLTSAQTFTVNNLKYTIVSGSTASISGYDSKPTGILNIPSIITNAGIQYTVTSIGNDTFSHCTGLTSVSIPNSVTSIGVAAFSDCPGLTSVSIPNSVTSIGDFAFISCKGLTSLSIPNSVTSIGHFAFRDCSGLTSLNISNSLTSIGFDTFSYCTGLTSVNIPNSVKSIGFSAFYNCTGLTSLNIPNSVTSIGDYAFSDCTGLTSLSIPNSVTSISPYAFNNCKALKSVNVGWASPLIIDNTVFFNINLKNVALNVSSPGNVDDYKKAYIWEDFSSFNPVLSTKSYLLDKSILVFPNPTKDFISVSGLSQTVSYNIFSVLGAKVSNGSVSNNEKIDVQSLTNGVYFMELEEGHTTKFIKK
jgi:hypothetical protein